MTSPSSSPVFDLDALRQWQDFPLPADRDRWPALLNQIRGDVAAAVEFIDELMALEESAAELGEELRDASFT